MPTSDGHSERIEAERERWDYMRYLVEKYAESDSDRERLLVWLREQQEKAERD